MCETTCAKAQSWKRAWHPGEWLQPYSFRTAERVCGDGDEEGGGRWKKTVTLGLFRKGPGVVNPGV